jgi:hypothetical protein
MECAAVMDAFLVVDVGVGVGVNDLVGVDVDVDLDVDDLSSLHLTERHWR